MKSLRGILGALALVLLLACSAYAVGGGGGGGGGEVPPGYDVIFDFGGYFLDSEENVYYNGVQPYGDVTVIGNRIYGMASNTDAGMGRGCIFSIKTDGSDPVLLHAFGDGGDRLQHPHGSLTLSADKQTLYGIVPRSRDDSYPWDDLAGGIFRIGVDGTGYSVMQYFDPGNGSDSPAALTLVGDFLYGTTKYEGTNQGGTFFKIGTDGNNYTILRNFEVGWPGNMGCPVTTLVYSAQANKLFGVSEQESVIFSLPLSGSSIDPVTDSSQTQGIVENGNGLVLVGNQLYGMTGYGGNGNGTIYTVGTDGSGYSVLHAFNSDMSEGYNPLGALSYFGDRLYGTATYGGSFNEGTVFSVKPDGSDFTVLYEFRGGPDDGGRPAYGKLSQYRGKIYGMTLWGGINGQGTVFSFQTQEYSIIDSNWASMEGLDLDETEIGDLVQLYFDGKADPGNPPSPVVIDGLEWEYFDWQIEGHNPGDYFEEGGYAYFYFGSGVRAPLGGGGGAGRRRARAVDAVTTAAICVIRPAADED